MQTLTIPTTGPAIQDEASEVSQRLAERLQTFKALVRQADQEAICNQGEISRPLVEQVRAGFRAIGRTMHEELDRLSPEVQNEFGQVVRSEVLPYLLLTRTGERSYSKPRGYAGDFLTIAWFYENRPEGLGQVGALLDRCFLDSPGVVAVQNRRQLLVEEILRTVASKPADEPVHITSLACGPAAEIFDAFEQVENPSRLHVTLIDMDEQALAHVAEQAKARHLESQIQLVHGNLIRFALGRQELKLPAQNLIYSIGLIDYLADNLVVKLANWIHGLLAPGGRTVLGNFHPGNPSKQFMEHILDWRLIHRSEADMDAVYLRSAFQRPCTRIRFEEQEINLFAECVK